MTPEEYTEKLTKLNEMMGIDPDPDSALGKELTALADQLSEYERATWPHLYPQGDDVEEWPDTDSPPEDFEPGTP